MTTSRFRRITLFVLAMMLMPAFSAFSQSYNDAVEKFNEAHELTLSRDFANAIVAYKETIAICEQVGSEADEIKARAEQRIPSMAFNIAGTYIQQRNFPDGIVALIEAVELAEKYNSEEIRRRALGNIPRAYLQQGNIYYRDGESELAAEQYRAALEYAPTYATAYYQLGLVYRQLDEMEESLRLFDRSIELATQQNDTENANRARNAARDYLVFVGASMTENRQYSRAVEVLRRALNYDNAHGDTYYRLAEAYNAQARWSDAISAANNALQYDQSPRADRAKIYFELGVAQKNSGNNRAACDAFENAAFGDFRDAAEHEIEHELNC